MCLYPRLIDNQKYKPNKKNGGIVPPVYDKRVLVVPVGCGQCIECRKQYARSWQVRLLEDIKHNTKALFVTFTFSNESIAELIKRVPKTRKKKLKVQGETLEIDVPIDGWEIDNQIAKIATRLFLERWRKKHKKSLRHWLVTELGHEGTENIHLHGLVWTNEPWSEIISKWQYGYGWPGTWVNGQTINYIVKYINKIDVKYKTYKPKVLTSAGIGAGYIKLHNGKPYGNSRENNFKYEDTNETYRTGTGHKIALPTYYRNKIYTDEEREALWLAKLNKNERWVCGQRIDLNKGEKEYYMALEWHRKRNKELGYGDDKKNWKRQEYERQRRVLMINKRIGK